MVTGTSTAVSRKSTARKLVLPPLFLLPPLPGRGQRATGPLLGWSERQVVADPPVERQHALLVLLRLPPLPPLPPHPLLLPHLGLLLLLQDSPCEEGEGGGVQHLRPKEENDEIDINEMCSIDDESGDGQSTTFDNDVDSEVSFEDDADEKKKTGLNTQREALKMQWKRWNAQRFDAGRGHTKNEMEIGIENRHFTKR